MIAETAPIALIMSKMSDNTIVSTNDDWNRMFDVEPGAVIGRKTREFYVDPDDRTLLRDTLAAKGFVRNFEAQLKTDKGEPFWALVNASSATYKGERVLLAGVLNITERRESEQALKESEERYALAMEGSHEGLWDWDLRNDEIYISPYIATLLELPGGDLRISPEQREATMHPDDIAAVTEAIRAHLRGETEFFASEYRARIRGGGYRWVHHRGLGLRGEDGRVYRMAGSLGDITERRQAEQEIAEKEAQLRLALTHMPGGMLVADKNGKFVFFNPQYSEMHDYPDDLLKVGGSDRDEARFQAKRGDYGPGRIAEVIERAYVPFKSGAPEQYERTMQDGKTLQINVAPTPEGGYVTIATDITERKRAEQELAEKEAQLRIALDNMPGGFRLVDNDRNYVFFNQQYLDLYDFPEGLLKVGDSNRIENLYSAQRGDFGPGDPDALADQWRDALPVQSEATSWVRETSAGKMLQVSTAPTPDGGVVNIVTDITERKRAERELAGKTGQLEAMLENMPDAVYVPDSDMRFVVFNDKYLSVNDVPPDLIGIGKPMEDIIRHLAEHGAYGPGDPEELTRQRLAVVLGSEPVRRNWTTPDSRYLDIRSSPMKDGGIVVIFSDITERKEAEEVLAEKETQLRIALDNMPGGMRLVDKDRNNVLFNSRYLELYDFPDGLLKVGETSRVENLYAARRGDFGPGDPEALTDEWHAALPVQTEPTSWEATPVGGKILQVDTSPTPDGGVVNIVSDITERKRAERELAAKEAQLRIALDSMPGGIRLVDGNRNFVLCNQQYIDLFDLPKGLLKVGDSIRVENLYCAQRGDLGPGDPETLADEWLAYAPELTEPSGWEYTLEGGKVLQVRSSPTRDGGVVNIVSDITERMRAEQELRAANDAVRESESLFRQTSRLASLGHWAWDEVEDRCTYCSEELARIHGMTVEEYLASKSSMAGDLELVHPDDRDRYNEATRGWGGDGKTYDVEYRILRPDGEMRHVRELAEGFFDDSGRIVRSIGTKQDITERKQAERELAEKEALLRLVIDNMPGAIIYTDNELNLILCNDHVAKFDMAAGELLQPGSSYPNYVRYLAEHGYYGEGDVDAIVAEVVESLRNPSDKTFEARTSDGHIHQVRRRRVAAGGTVTVATDITERKRAEDALRAAHEALQESEVLFRTFVDNVPAEVSVKDTDGKFLFVNPEFRRRFGVTDEEILSKTVDEVLPKSVAEQSHDEHREVVETGAVVISEQQVPYGGTTHTHLVVRFPVPDPSGAITRVATFVPDITEQKQAEEALRESEARFRAFLDNSPDAITLKDADGRYLLGNREFERLSGISNDELHGKVEIEVFQGSAELLSNIAEHEQKVIETKSVVREEREMEGPDGALQSFSITKFPILDRAGNVTGIGTTNVDITERNNIERMKNEFVSTVSHELRTPLTSIAGSLDLLIHGVAGEIPEQAMPMIEIAQKNSHRLVRLINDILDIEKIEAGKMVFNYERVGIGQLLDQAVAANQGYADGLGVGLRLVSKAETASVLGDPDLLMQVMTNLISNAAKFSPEDGEVEIAVTLSDDTVRIAVSDHGSGIPDEFRGRIFEKFAQADSSDTRQRGGTGLGLSICKAIIERHGGEIGFESEPGVCTTFYFELSRWRDAGGLPAAGAAPGGPLQLLVCEDDPDVLTLLTMMLEREGFDVAPAASAAEAKRLLGEVDVAAMILDLALPDQDGISLIHELREDAATADLPIVVVSAKAKEGKQSLNGDAFGVVDWLEKPIDPKRLFSAICRALSRVTGHKPRVSCTSRTTPTFSKSFAR